ncbi:MAG: hypothetical protein DRJ61_13885 [Acidobacteria bacterium]|nr:MAG: hypothetical protein DRJ61_13885 [Acidobacteriota bacterium]
MQARNKFKSNASSLLTALLLASAIAGISSGCGSERVPPSLSPESEDLDPGLDFGAAKGFNLLVVTLDTVRADYVGAFGGPHGLTPNINALSTRGVCFHNAVSVAPITAPAHASLFTGTYPPTHGIRVNGFHQLSPKNHTLAGILRRAGYRTAAVIGSVVLDASIGLDQGFDIYDDSIDSGNYHGVQTLERPASTVTDLALNHLAGWTDGGPPGFLWVHYFDAHHPYQPPQPFASRYPEAPYAGEIASVDQEFGRLLATLEASDLADRTVVVVTSDHGEGLGEHGEETHTHLIYESTMRVPLIMVPGNLLYNPVHIRQSVVSLCDITPTLLALLGVPASDGLGDPLAFDGIDLFDHLKQPEATRRSTVYMETLWPQLMHGWEPIYGLRSPEDKYISAPVPEYYQISDDPAEIRNLLPNADRHILERADHLRSALSLFPGAKEPVIPVDSSDTTITDQLTALGYVVDVDSATPGPQAVKPEPLSTMIVRWQNRWQELLASAEARDANTREVLLRSVALSPDNSSAHVKLGEFFMNHKEISKANRCFIQATLLAPDSADAWMRLAEVRGANKDWSGAEEAIERAHRLAPDDYRVAMLEGRLAFSVGQWDRVIEKMLEARRGAPPVLYKKIDALIRRAERKVREDY